MTERLASFETFSQLKELCKKLIQNPKDSESIKKLYDIIEQSPKSFIRVVQPTVLSTFYPVLKKISEDKSSFSVKEKQLIIDTLQILFDKSIIDKTGVFFNLYGFLLFEIYDHLEHKVLKIQEEYKLSIIKCTKSLAKAVSSDLIFDLYNKMNAPKLCQMLYAAIEIAKHEQLKILRIEAMECIMCLARIFTDEDFHDIVIKKQVAEVFLFFLPGVASGLKQIALEDEKIGHKIPMVALKAWGRFVTLLMQDYNNAVTIPNISDLKIGDKKFESITVKRKWTNTKEMNNHLINTTLSPQWYNDTDKKLQLLIIDFMKLTRHGNQKVRMELTEMCGIVLENCLCTMPLSSRYLIEIVITLTEDEDSDVSQRSNEIIRNLSNKLSSSTFKSLLETLEEGFINGINALPRKFNGIDEKEQLSALNLLNGYLVLFGKHKLHQVLLTANNLNNLLMTIIHISELEKCGTGLLEENILQDLNFDSNYGTPWKKFIHFKDEAVLVKLEKLCGLLGSFESLTIVTDFLLDVFLDDDLHRKETIFILNAVLGGINTDNYDMDIIKNIIDIYVDDKYWKIPVYVTEDEDVTLNEVQNNAVQISLLLEGIGKIALLLGNKFDCFILKILYIILEKAGSTHSLIKSAGFAALKNVSVACGYSTITDLIINNIDYFTYHLERRLNNSSNKENVLAVFSVVLKYSTIDVLKYLSYTINEVLVQSCDKYRDNNINVYLEVFKVFVKSLKRWLNIEIKEEIIKSRADKMKEYEEFKVTGVEEINENYDDDFEGKTPEELYKEYLKDKEKLENEQNGEELEVGEYKKPDPPLEIKLTVSILKRCLNFLPSKNRLRKLLVLEILRDGLEIIRDWEDELLPIVHQVWSPLVDRFKEYNDPVIINYSFSLLVILARLSKEFIRSRTIKEVLPSVLEIMNKMSKESYLKDKGSSYRYSQAYKLQINILEHLGKVVIYLDMDDTSINKVFNCVSLYMSDKQPIPLQVNALDCLKQLSKFDSELILKQTQSSDIIKSIEYDKNFKILNDFIEIK